MDLLTWATWAIRVPSRLACLAIIGVVMAIDWAAGVFAPGGEAKLDDSVWLGAMNFISGIAILVVLLGHRWFLMGGAVVRRRAQGDRAFRSLLDHGPLQ